MCLSGDIRSSRDRSREGALAAPPLCLRATLIITELPHLPQVFPPVCRGENRSLNTDHMLVREDGTSSDWRKRGDFCQVFWTSK